MTTINMTREGLSAVSTLIERNPHLSQILDGRSHFTENCEWTFDEDNNRQAYKLHLPKDKLDILKFLFNSEIIHQTTESFWGVGGVHFRTRVQACKMIRRILKRK